MRPRAPPGDFPGRLVFCPPIADLSTTHQPSLYLQLSRQEICPQRATLHTLRHIHTEKWRRAGTRFLGPAPEKSGADATCSAFLSGESAGVLAPARRQIWHRIIGQGLFQYRYAFI
mgnify:CR=1 FL=1